MPAYTGSWPTTLVRSLAIGTDAIGSVSSDAFASGSSSGASTVISASSDAFASGSGSGASIVISASSARAVATCGGSGWVSAIGGPRSEDETS